MANYETIKSQYAGYAAESDASTRIKQVADSLKKRPHVQPVPIDEIRSDILKQPPSMAVIQTILFTILLAMVEFLVLPSAYASHVAFLTLCVGASAGIYLSTR
jgi:cell division protein FtsX